jgi:hypothetical protein
MLSVLFSIKYGAFILAVQRISFPGVEKWTVHFPKCASGTDLPLTRRGPF